MKYSLLFIVLLLMSSVFSQEDTERAEEGHFGVAVNSSIVYELNSIFFAPTAFYYSNKNQFELGVGIDPFDRMFERKTAVEFNYKYFVKGIDDRFNTYFNGRTGFTRVFHNTPYFTDFDNSNIREYYVSFMVGYGFQFKLFERAYIGTNFALGFGTFSRKYVNLPETYHGNEKLFEESYGDAALQLNIGYRF